jgi:hypothetical protein
MDQHHFRYKSKKMLYDARVERRKSLSGSLRALSHPLTSPLLSTSHGCGVSPLKFHRPPLLPLLVSIHIVAYRPVAKWRLCKQRPLLCNARNIHARNKRRTVFSLIRDEAVSGQRFCKHVPVATDRNATIEERCFLCGPCRDVISKEKSCLILQFCEGGCEEKTLCDIWSM